MIARTFRKRDVRDVRIACAPEKIEERNEREIFSHGANVEIMFANGSRKFLRWRMWNKLSVGASTLFIFANSRKNFVQRHALFLSRPFEHVPRRVRQIHEVVELSRAAKPQTAVNHYAFAVDVAGLIAQQISREICELIVPPETLHRMIRSRALFELF